MTVKDLIDSNIFTLVNEGDFPEAQISKLFCCDLLSIAMSRAPSGSAWVTVMGNMNTLAVASLCDVACIVLAEGVQLDEVAGTKAVQQGITVFRTDLPIFDAALMIQEKLTA